MSYQKRIDEFLKAKETVHLNTNTVFEQRLNETDPNWKPFVNAVCDYIDRNPMSGWEFEGIYEMLKFQPIGGLWSDDKQNKFYKTQES